MYAGGGEAADQTVRLMLAGCETAVRLGGSGLKNVLAISLALAKNNKQISGKVNLGKMLKETRDLRLFPMTKEQYREFTKMAKPQKLPYSVIRDKDSGKIEVVLPVTELERANLIFEKMLYNLSEQKSQEPEPEVSADEQEPTADKQPEEEIKHTEKSEQLEIPVPPENKQQEDNDPKKESRLASDLNATRRSSSIWKESGNTIRTTSDKTGRVSVMERLKGFQKQIEAANSLEPTRTRVKNREQAR